MYTHYNSHFRSKVITIHPGEYYATAQDTIISTILGSCIAVALYDPILKQGGLNHFMLPASAKKDTILISEPGKYGIHAMELLINKLLAMGSQKKDLRAKVFGGGSVLSTGKTSNSVPVNNIEFAYTFLKTESIPIDASDVGGTRARKIFMYPQSFKIMLKRVGGDKAKKIELTELSYFSPEKKKEKPGETAPGSVLFFDKE